MYRTPPPHYLAFKINQSTNKEEGHVATSLCETSHEKGEPQFSTSKRTEQKDGMNGAFQDECTGGPFASAGCSCLGSKPLLLVIHFYPSHRLWYPDHQPKSCEIIAILCAAPLGGLAPSHQHSRINVSSATSERITDPSHSFFGSRLTECFPALFIPFFT